MSQHIFFQEPPFYFVPILHYTMECAEEVRKAFLELQPDCVAVELPEPLQEECHMAAARLPDISCIVTEDIHNERKILLAEPCDPCFEALRSAGETGTSSYCIDLNVSRYPLQFDAIPDPYAIHRIGAKAFFSAITQTDSPTTELDAIREEHMARRLKELSFSHERILVVVGAHHFRRLKERIHDTAFTRHEHVSYQKKELLSPTEESILSILAEPGWISKHYEEWREHPTKTLDRQRLFFSLIKGAIPEYEQETRSSFPRYGLQLIMRYLRKYAAIRGKLLPDLYQLVTACMGCIDHNFAYEVWKLAVAYPFHINRGALEEIDTTVEAVWGTEKKIWFHRKLPSKKSSFLQRLKKEKGRIHLEPLNPYTICSYPPEDGVVEGFGKYLQQKAVSSLQEEGAKTILFSSSLEDGVDVRETIRHFTEKKLYVKTMGRPSGGVGSLVVIFDEDHITEKNPHEHYPWKLTWLGENEQESDMAFYASHYQDDIVGPGIARAHYGGFMLSYPCRRMYDVWSDPDYENASSKLEVLTMAAIDYATKPVVVFVASKCPSEKLKRYAERQGRKLFFIPISSISKEALRKVRSFHVLDGYHRRQSAADYIH